MNPKVEAILVNLRAVARERAARVADPTLGARVTGLKLYQQQRFANTYADLLASARYGPAARFFLDELYGPADFTDRDAQFERVVPALVRLFPREIVETATALSELHALTESLDTAMANNASTSAWTRAGYSRAWRKTAGEASREAQIDMTLDLARRLDRLTGSALLRKSLRLMRAPARAAGLADLQRFLESGFDTFAALGGAEDFIRLVEARERAFVASMFRIDPNKLDAGSGGTQALALLPGEDHVSTDAARTGRRGPA